MRQFNSYFLYLTVFVTGAAVLIIEILGTRVLAPFYGSTIFVWSSLITVTLAALALGYWIGGKIIDLRPDHRILYGAIILAGITLLVPLFTGASVLAKTDFLGIRFGPLGATLLLFFVPLFFLGTVSPIAIKLRARTLDKIGVTAGKLYAVATLGSLIGGLLSGFFLVPYYSLQIIFISLSALLIVVGLLGITVYARAKIAAKKEQYAIVVLLILLIATLYYGFNTLTNKPVAQETRKNVTASFVTPATMPQFSTLFTSKGEVEANVIYREPSIYGNIVVFDYVNYVRCFLTDGTNGGCWNFMKHTPSTYTRNMKLLLDKLTAEREVKDILIVGIGAGTFLKDLDGSGYSIDGVEINPKMPKVAKNFFLQPQNLDYRIIIDDGRHYLSTTDKKYDVIVLDLCYVNEANVHLWTEEFYALTKNHLKNPNIGVVIVSRGIVNGPRRSDRLGYIIANAMGKSFVNLYSVGKLESQADEFGMEIFVATNQPITFSSILRESDRWTFYRWRFNPAYASATDDMQGKLLQLFRPVTEKIREQTLTNFGYKILLPI